MDENRAFLEAPRRRAAIFNAREAGERQRMLSSRANHDLSVLLRMVRDVPTYTYRNGRLVEIADTIVAKDTEFTEPISNTMIILPGVKAITTGPVSGTVQLMESASLDARGPVTGTVSVADAAHLTVHERAGGTLHIAAGGVAHLLPGSVALGTMRVDGTLINEGTRGVQISGSGYVDDRDGSTVRQPDAWGPDGTSVYYRV